MMSEIETQPQQLAPKRSSLTESEGEDAVTKGLLWKQGRGRSLSFLKPWRERLVVVDHKKMTLTYYQISDGFDWLHSPPPEEAKGSIPLEEAIIEDLPDAGRPHSFAVLNGDVHVNLSCQTETQKSQWMALLQNISQSGRSEANKEKFQRLHQMGPAASSPGKLLRQTSRLNRALTPKQLTPLATEGNKDSLSDDDNFSTATTEKQRTDTEDRSRSPSPTPPIPPPRPVSRQPLPSPPLESTDPDEIFQQAVLSAALDKKEPVPSESVAASSLAIHIDITQEQSGDSCNQDVAISSPNLKQLSEEQRQQEMKNREMALRERQEEQQKIEEERLKKEKEVEAKTNEIQGKLSEYRRTTFREIAKGEREKAEFEKLKSTMTEREAAYLVAEQGEHSSLVKELKRTAAEETEERQEQDTTSGTSTNE